MPPSRASGVCQARQQCKKAFLSDWHYGDILWAGAMGHDPRAAGGGLPRCVRRRFYSARWIALLLLKEKVAGYVWWRQAGLPSGDFYPSSSRRPQQPQT
ncbi:hypothetical protein KCP76_09330 [Salmonella enterica subsp. enterica serovar Weltevreden]|nr:hypothetical protein KCP76_09330 [Salmonella enterica subsp. enterica serovar Weltevreden]